MVDKNIDGLESDRDFLKMTQDIKKNDDTINIAGIIGLPEHKMAPNHHVQNAQKTMMKRDPNGRWRSDHPVAGVEGPKHNQPGMRGTQMAVSNQMQQPFTG